MRTTVTPRNDRWTARPALGSAVRLVALLAPVAVGVLAAVLLSRTVPGGTTSTGTAGWWAVVLGGSAVAVWLTDRLARRLLPLAVLLDLSLVFPDRAPSRLRAARTASVRDMDASLARLRGEGRPMEPYEAAETLVTLVGILGLHDKRTRGHSERVRAFTDLLSEELGLDEDARMRLRWAALVHDLGKLTVPEPVLNGGTDLRDEDWVALKRHPAEGVRLVEGLLPWLGEWGGAVGEHHERYDGTGYPNGLAGDEISLSARIVALCDSFEVMTSARSYSPARSAAAGREELIRCSGSQFDPALVRAFVGISLGRLRWVLGPVTWLAELPFVATSDRAGQAVKVGAVTALVSTMVGVSALPAPGEDRPTVELPATVALAPQEPVSGTTGGAATGPTSEDGELVSGGTPGVRGSGASLGTSPTSPGVPQAGGDLTGGAAQPAPGTAAGRPGTAGGTGSGGGPGSGGSTDPRPGSGTDSGTDGDTGGDIGGGDGRPGSGDGPAPTRTTDPVRPDAPRPVGPTAPAVPSTMTRYLTASGLSATPPAVPGTRVVRPLGSTSFDSAPLPAGLHVDAPPQLSVVLDLLEGTGNPALSAVLSHCAVGGTGCVPLAEGYAVDGNRSTPDEVRYGLTLVTGKAVQTVPAGRVLRLELVRPVGSRGDALVLVGAPGPHVSRLVLP